MQPSRPKVINPEIILANEVKKLTPFVKRMTSFKYRFLFGIVEGFGSVIGATIVVSIVLLILNQLQQIGFLQPMIEYILNLSGR